MQKIVKWYCKWNFFHALAVINHKEITKMKNYFLAIAMLAFVLSACGAPATLTLEQTISPTAVIMSTNTPFPVIPTETPTPQVLESTPVQTSVNDTAELFSSDRLGLCFSYPQGYTQNSYDDTVAIAAPDLPGTDKKGRFWLEISDSYNRTALKIADEDMTIAVSQGVPPENLGWWSITLGGEEAVVLDGMPGQYLQRRVYVVHEQTLYVLAFWPTRSENKATGDQMETLYTAVTNSWAWSPCSASE
jgi:hypothetical protein